MSEAITNTLQPGVAAASMPDPFCPDYFLTFTRNPKTGVWNVGLSETHAKEDCDKHHVIFKVAFRPPDQDDGTHRIITDSIKVWDGLALE